MNGLTLRINPSSKKMKNSMGFSPITLSNDEYIGNANQLYENFIHANSADEQLTVIKSILDSVRESCNASVMRFLSLVFLQAEAKHPVKCFITRHITKNDQLQEAFAPELAKEIEKLIVLPNSEYAQYITVVSRIATCIENFPAGALAIRAVQVQLAEHLKKCLECCIKTLSEVKLSPTEKNEIYNLSHLALRLVLYIVQKLSEENVSTLISMFGTFRIFIKYLIFDDDSPMDTKNICGILYLSMELLEYGSDSWISILDSTQGNKNINNLLENEAAQLSLCSALPTVVPVDRMQSQTVDGKPAVVCLTEKIIAIGERSSSECTFMLGVTRAIVLISKMLDKLPDGGGEVMQQVLGFVWPQLEHYMDSVRHLAAQALAHVVRHCANMDRSGDDTGLNTLFTALSSLDETRKSYYVSLTSLTAQLGAARVITRLPTVIRDVIDALSVQAVQASASTALETLLQRHAREANAATLYQQWVIPVLTHVAERSLDSTVLNILENLLARAVALDEEVFNYIVPHITDPRSAERSRLQSVLMLLSVSRKAAAARLPEDHSPDLWKGIIEYDVLRAAAVDAVEETRILSLALVAESSKTTEPFTPGDLQFVLYYLRYNINAQSPNFRQLTLSSMKKFIKRLEDSYKALTRADSSAGAHYPLFLEQLRELCFAGLIPGANYSRRFVALQLLAWAGGVQLNDYQSLWKDEYIETLLVHLEDSYENNKALALQILDTVPASIFEGKKYRISLDIEVIIREASSMKPTDCVSAAYKLDFIKRKLPDLILQGETWNAAEPVSLALLTRLLRETQLQLLVCRRSVVLAARQAPIYGVLHCIGHLMTDLDADAISEDEAWTSLVQELIETCVEVNAAVASVVNNASPEGHLPMDAGGVAVTDHGNSGDVMLEDGRPVTAQMVLLCAWRSVKEVSLLLGTISSRLTISGEGRERGTLSPQQMALIGEHFTQLLAETKHRGAFEQAYVGFTRLLARLWRCRSAPLHGLPRAWMQTLTAAVATPQPTRSATRRSAGLPFMIQALVTTELQVQGNPKCLHECMTTLLRLARSRPTPNTKLANTTPSAFDSKKSNEDNKGSVTSTIDYALDSKKANKTTEENIENKDSTSSIDGSIDDNNKPSSYDSSVETRTHSLNILRTLFRNSVLEESLAGYVGEGLMVALQGFEGDTWMERNSSTLLFSALMVRVFGVTRDRHSDVPAIRNTMTGRIFFLRYPHLYDFILNKLLEAEHQAELDLQPALYPVLVVLGRLHVSALEGTASALRLAALAPPVMRAAAARPAPARRLAAAALPPLVPPVRYFPQLISMFKILKSPDIKRNYCHGTLLQLTRLLDLGPDLLPSLEESQQLAKGIEDTFWILAQANGELPCYVIADEYVKMTNLIISRYPSLISDEMLMVIRDYINKMLFTQEIPRITLGREICLANCIYLYFVILNKIPDECHQQDIVYKGLSHKSYEVVLNTLNYLLILYNKLEVDGCSFQKHLYKISNDNIFAKLRDSPEYIEKLCEVFQNSKYLECIQKALKVLTLEKDTQRFIVGGKIGKTSDISDDEIIKQLFDCIQNEHENFTHIYLESLCNFVTGKLKDSNIPKGTLLEIIRVIFACSSSENNDSTRVVVANFMEHNLRTLLNDDLLSLTEEEKFEFKSTLWATMATILEDDDPAVRQRAADTIVMSQSRDNSVVATSQSRDTSVVDLPQSRDNSVIDGSQSRDTSVVDLPQSRDNSVIDGSQSRDTSVVDLPQSRDNSVIDGSQSRDTSVVDLPQSRDNSVIDGSQSRDTSVVDLPQSRDNSVIDGSQSRDTSVVDLPQSRDNSVIDGSQSRDTSVVDLPQSRDNSVIDGSQSRDTSVVDLPQSRDNSVIDGSQSRDTSVVDLPQSRDNGLVDLPRSRDSSATVTSRGSVVAARAAEVMRGALAGDEDGPAMYVLLALLDFKSEVCMTDEISDECRVFDQNERYNIFLEECMWTTSCADALIQLSQTRQQSTKRFVQSIIENTVYRRTLDKLCNMILFRKLINDTTMTFKNEALNPKIELFIRKLS